VSLTKIYAGVLFRKKFHKACYIKLVNKGIEAALAAGAPVPHEEEMELATLKSFLLRMSAEMAALCA
jgi:hypothetical protein